MPMSAHLQAADGDQQHDLSALFESARTLWQDGELRAAWGIYERICDLLKAEPVT